MSGVVIPMLASYFRNVNESHCPRLTAWDKTMTLRYSEDELIMNITEYIIITAKALIVTP